MKFACEPILKDEGEIFPGDDSSSQNARSMNSTECQTSRRPTTTDIALCSNSLAYLDTTPADDVAVMAISLHPERVQHLASAQSEPRTDAGAVFLVTDAADQPQGFADAAAAAGPDSAEVVTGIAAAVGVAAVRIAHCTIAEPLALSRLAAAAADLVLGKAGAAAEESSYSAGAATLMLPRVSISAAAGAAPSPYRPIARRHWCHDSAHIAAANISSAQEIDPAVEGID